jgi:hypothetical protein
MKLVCNSANCHKRKDKDQKDQTIEDRLKSLIFAIENKTVIARLITKPFKYPIRHLLSSVVFSCFFLSSIIPSEASTYALTHAAPKKFNLWFTNIISEDIEFAI